MPNKENFYIPPSGIIVKSGYGYIAYDRWGLPLPKEIIESALFNAPDDYSLEDYESDLDRVVMQENMR